MPRQLTWADAEDLAILLHERYPDHDPLAVRFTDLHACICALPEFGDDPKASSEGKLEAIQMAWLAEKRGADNR
jgi:FeS assembly protein IscX